jgi:hypothetical protein
MSVHLLRHELVPLYGFYSVGNRTRILFHYNTLTQKNKNASRGLKNAGPQSLSRADEDVPP